VAGGTGDVRNTKEKLGHRLVTVMLSGPPRSIWHQV
jgi:hypothetical protein